MSSRFVSLDWQKRYMTCCILQPATNFFACRIVVLRLFNVINNRLAENLKPQNFLDAAGMHTRKSENWELEIQDRSSRLKYGWLVSNTADDFLKKKIAEKLCKSKIEAHPVTAGHQMAFKHRILFATYLAANFGCYLLTITPDIVLRQMNDRKIERSDGRCFGRQQLFANCIENFISHEKKVTRHGTRGPIFTKH